MTDNEMMAAVEELEALAAERKAIEAKEDAIKDRLKASIEAMQTESVELSNGRKIAWKEVFSNRIDTKALKTKLPEIYNQFLSIGVTRRFTIA